MENVVENLKDLLKFDVNEKFLELGTKKLENIYDFVKINIIEDSFCFVSTLTSVFLKIKNFPDLRRLCCNILSECIVEKNHNPKKIENIKIELCENIKEEPSPDNNSELINLFFSHSLCLLDV
jgi:hypothetical protein